MGKQLCFTADDSLVQAIDVIAETIKRSRSETIALMLTTIVENPEFKRNLISSGGTGIIIKEQPKRGE
jgi:predicted transcriptional regulator